MPRRVKNRLIMILASESQPQNAQIGPSPEESAARSPRTFFPLPGTYTGVCPKWKRRDLTSDPDSRVRFPLALVASLCIALQHLASEPMNLIRLITSS